MLKSSHSYHTEHSHFLSSDCVPQNIANKLASQTCTGKHGSISSWSGVAQAAKPAILMGPRRPAAMKPVGGGNSFYLHTAIALRHSPELLMHRIFWPTADYTAILFVQTQEKWAREKFGSSHGEKITKILTPLSFVWFSFLYQRTAGVKIHCWRLVSDLNNQQQIKRSWSMMEGRHSSFSRRIYSVKSCSTAWDCHNPQCQLE